MAFRRPMLQAGVALGRVLVAAQSQFLGALSAGRAPAGRVRALSRHPWVPLCPAPTPQCPAVTDPCPSEGPAHPTQPPWCCSRAVAWKIAAGAEAGSRAEPGAKISSGGVSCGHGHGLEGWGGHCLVPIASTEPPSPGLGGLLLAPWGQRSPGQAGLRGAAAAAPWGARGELLCLAGRGEHPRRLSRVRLLLHKRWLLSQPEPTCVPVGDTNSSRASPHRPGAALPGLALGLEPSPRHTQRGQGGSLPMVPPVGLLGTWCWRCPGGSRADAAPPGSVSPCPLTPVPAGRCSPTGCPPNSASSSPCC